MTEPALPKIRRLEWADIRSVLPNEAHHFTPWIAENLDMLADVIGLDDLQAEATEWSVDEFRLDVLATGRDADGDEIVVVIENQYGSTDHDHLGKLVTYAARAEATGERLLAIWTVETARPAHLAAVEFLNRISPASIGWMIIAPRFIPGPDGEHLVHFDVLAEPNEFLRSTPARAVTVNPDKVEFMTSLAESASADLEELGFRNTWCDSKGRMIRIYLPADLPAASWVELRVLSTKTQTRFVGFVSNSHATFDDCYEVLDGIRARHGSAIREALGDDIAWHESTGTGRSDWARWFWDRGFEHAPVDEARSRLVSFAAAWLQGLSRDGDEDFPNPADLEGRGRADAETVFSFAALVQPGEWTSYGELSRAITGSPGSAMSIGNTARTRTDFPNPHRVLNASGAIPDGWTTHDGHGGPEVCEQLLRDEGVNFDERGRAGKQQHVSADDLLSRR